MPSSERWRPCPPPVLLAARCRACGQLAFPPRPHCPGCWQQTDTVPLPRRGMLYSYTTVHPGRSGGEPRLLGYADFAGVRVLGPLSGEPPRIGAPVTIATAPAATAGGSPRQYVFEVGEP